MVRIAKAEAPLPSFVAPELATLVAEVPRGEGWIHEIKFDGYRMQLRVDGQSVSMLSRNGKDWTGKFPRLIEQARSLGARRVILDGEVVHLDESGKSSFSRLVDELGEGAACARRSGPRRISWARWHSWSGPGMGACDTPRSRACERTRTLAMSSGRPRARRRRTRGPGPRAR